MCIFIIDFNSHLEMFFLCLFLFAPEFPFIANLSIRYLISMIRIRNDPTHLIFKECAWAEVKRLKTHSSASSLGNTRKRKWMKINWHSSQNSPSLTQNIKSSFAFFFQSLIKFWKSIPMLCVDLMAKTFTKLLFNFSFFSH